MPTVPGYTGIPTETPSVSVPSTYQDITAKSETFGADQGRALQNIGTVLGQAGDRFGQTMEFFNKVAADEATNNYLDATNKLLDGNPEKGDTGFYGKRGRNAMEAFPIIRDQMTKLREEYRGKLQNPSQQLHFDSETRRNHGYIMAQVRRHYDTQFETYKLNTAKATQAVGEQSASAAAANLDYEGFHLALAKQLKGVDDEIAAQGGSEEQKQAGYNRVRAAAVKQWTTSLALKNPIAAQQFLEQNKDAVDKNEYPQLAHGLKKAAEDMQALIDTKQIPEPSNWKSPRIGGSSDAVDRFLDLAEQHESGGRNINQGVVGPRGGLNPSTGTVTGPSTASGYYQITDTTWRNFRGEVDGAEKYARAIDAPKEIQRAVAREIATSSGVQHWTDYNKTLRTAVQEVGLPVNGPITSRAPSTATITVAGLGANAKDYQLTAAQAEEYYKISSPVKQQEFLNALPLAADTVLPPLDEGQLPDATVPGLQGRIEELKKTIPKDDPQRLINAIKVERKLANATYADAQHALRIDNQMKKQKSSQTMSEIQKRMVSDSPNYPTTNEVLKNPNLTDDDQRTLVGFIERQTKPDPAAAISARNTRILFDRIHAEEGNPQKILDEKTIDDEYSKQNLTWDDHGKLITNFRESQSSTDKDIAAHKASLFKRAKARIIPYAAYGPITEGFIDADGEERFARYQRFVENKIKEYRENKKNPDDLFNPDKPDYVGKKEIVEGPPFGPPDEAKLIKDPKPIVPAVTLETAKTLPELQQLYISGKITVDQARKRAIELGVARPSPVPSTSQAPVMTR